MRTSLHGGDRHVSGITDDHLTGVSDGCRAWEGGNVSVCDAGRSGERIGEGTEAGAQNESNLRAQRGARENQFCSGVGECELVGHSGAKARKF